MPERVDRAQSKVRRQRNDYLRSRDRRSATDMQTYDDVSDDKQAFSYLHKYRTEFEQIARARLASGELEDGIVVLSML